MLLNHLCFEMNYFFFVNFGKEDFPHWVSIAQGYVIKLGEKFEKFQTDDYYGFHDARMLSQE